MRLEMRLEQVEHQGLLNCAVHGQPVVTRNDDVEIVDAHALAQMALASHDEAEQFVF